jgi:hypothetical protein
MAISMQRCSKPGVAAAGIDSCAMVLAIITLDGAAQESETAITCNNPRLVALVLLVSLLMR